jgi:hypothetical protein
VDGQGPVQVNPVWEELWKLSVPSKVKIFGWKALHGIVPGMGVLANRHIKVAAQCPICKQGCEDITHLLFTCMRAKQVWRALGLWSYIKDLCRVDRSGSVILEEILTSPSKQSPVVGLLGLKETILVAGWYIWWQRREAVKGESVANVKKKRYRIIKKH